MSNWFQDIFGFRETDYLESQRKLLEITSENKINGYDIGEFHILSLRQLKNMVGIPKVGKLQYNHIVGNIKDIILQNDNINVQVASQFNLLEFSHPTNLPENGITRYINDRTQGPTCAMVCAAGTAYRNYLVNVGDKIGQTENNQINTLDDIQNLGDFFTVQNGYVDSTPNKLKKFNKYLEDPENYQLVKSLLKIGVHFKVQCTEKPYHKISQTYCSALPIAYSQCPSILWEPFAKLVLESAYEATFLATLYLNAREGTNNPVILTKLGGGVFGNNTEWIAEAIKKNCNLFRNTDLKVYLNHFMVIDNAYL